jgi:phytoene/squalene synthetase
MLSPNRIERICLREFGHFIRRHRRYFITFLAIYVYSLFSWKRLRLLRAGHCLAQHIDDVLDGDRQVDLPPLDYLDDLMRQIETDDYDLRASIPALACFTFRQADSPLRAELLALFRALRFDRERFEARRLLSRSQLEELHRNTFTHSMNASLMMVNSALRASDAPEMVGALSWVSPMRDLREDLARGLVNVPLEVLDGAESLDYDSLIEQPGIRAWMREEFRNGQEHLRATPKRLRSHFPKRGVLEIWAFYFEINRYAIRYKRKHRDILAGL